MMADQEDHLPNKELPFIPESTDNVNSELEIREEMSERRESGEEDELGTHEGVCVFNYDTWLCLYDSN